MVMQQTINNNSIGPIGLLWVIFIVLRIMEVITWHWGLVIFFPLLAYLGIILGCIVVAGFMACLGYLWWEYKSGIGKKV